MDRQPKQQKPTVPVRRPEPAPARPEPAANRTDIAPQVTTSNASVQRTLNSEVTLETRRRKILALQPTLGNSRVQRLLNSPVNPRIQRAIFITSDQLSGKKDHKLFGFKVDGALTSTFRAIESALDDFHKTNEDDSHTREKHLNTIIEKCREWLGNKNHKGAADEEKRSSLNRLLTEAQVEQHRVKITRELGVTRHLMDAMQPGEVEQFWQVVLAFERNDATSAMTLFNKAKGKLGDAAGLIESFMKRRQIYAFNKDLAASMNNPKFEMTNSAGSADAIKLVKDQAKAKLDRLTKLEADFHAATAAYTAYKADLLAKQQKLPTYTDLTPAQKTEYDRLEDKQYNPDVIKMTRFPILQGGTPLALELGKLKGEAEHYRALISGKAVTEKNKEKGFEKFTEPELYGVMGYTSNLYGAINSPLRFDVGDNAKFTAGHTALAGSIASALNKLKPYKGEVYRHGGDFPGFATVNVKGATVSDMAPLSTATDQKGPANAAEQHEVLEILTSVNGRDVSKMSMFGNKEGEVLFTPGARFRILAAFERNSTSIGTKHTIDQWKIRGQEKDPLFDKAMAHVQADDKRNEFRRVIIKTEVT